MRDFVRSLADPAQRTGQLARWRDAICPGIVGLRADQAEAVNGRIGEIARAVGLHPREQGCQPSALIIFSQEAEALARSYRSRLPITLSENGRWRLEQFASSDRPVRWISRVTEAAYDGTAINLKFGRLAGSRIQASTRTYLSAMLVIVDARQLQAVTLTRLGDYLAVVVLAQPKLGSKPPSQSILSMFDRADREPPGLTDYDRRYLASLYKASLDRSGSSQASSIRSMMARGPAPEPPADRPASPR